MRSAIAAIGFCAAALIVATLLIEKITLALILAGLTLLTIISLLQGKCGVGVPFCGSALKTFVDAT